MFKNPCMTHEDKENYVPISVYYTTAIIATAF